MTVNDAAGTRTAGTEGLRASDADREQAVAKLREHFESGHLGYDEFNQRMDTAYKATYAHELQRLLADLPGAQPRTVAPATSPRPARKTGAGKIIAIIALVLFAFWGLSWALGLIGAHPVLTTIGVAVVVWLVLKRRQRASG
ncbi:MAG: DUF1707 SHOCT-like domain-containing protein [Streptosporangiales bacterium]